MRSARNNLVNDVRCANALDEDLYTHWVIAFD